jgi:hypothetical protein
MAKPSGMLQAVCIFAILLGVLGVWIGLFGLVNVAAGGRVQDAIASVNGAGMTPEQVELQHQLYRDMQDATASWNTVNTPLFILEIVVSAGMIVGAVGTLRGRARGPVLLRRVLVCAIVLALVRFVPGMAIQYETARITGDYLERSFGAALPPGQQVPPEMQTVAATTGKLAVILGLALVAAMKLLEVGFYVFGWNYLRRSAITPGPGPLVAEVVES